MKNNKRITTKLFIATMLFLSSFTVFAQETVKEFETITDAINYSGDKSAVKKMVITGEIEGTDYCPIFSEWSLFFDLDLIFPNIESVEILTSQDIPDTDYINNQEKLRLRALFYWLEWSLDDNGGEPKKEIDSGAMWLKHFSAPNVKRIGSFAFNECKELNSVNFASAEETRQYSFNYCLALTKITDTCFPKLKVIGSGTFSNCYALTEIIFPSATTLGYESLYNTGLTELASTNIPNVIEIGDRSFASCKSLISVDLPNLEIMGDAFYRCGNLTTVNIPKVKTIHRYAFSACSSLTSINMQNVTAVEFTAFSRCNSLVSINLPKAIRIRELAFENCHSLETVSLGTELEKNTITGYQHSIFNFVPTEWVDLTLGENVKPEPDLINSIWHYGMVFPNDKVDYYWKSITIKYIGIEEVVQNATIDISPNPATDYFTLDFELKKSCNMEIILCGVLGKEILTIHNGFAESGLFSKTVDIEHLNSGVYFIKVLIDGKYATLEKIVVN